MNTEKVSDMVKDIPGDDDIKSIEKSESDETMGILTTAVRREGQKDQDARDFGGRWRE